MELPPWLSLVPNNVQKPYSFLGADVGYTPIHGRATFSLSDLPRRLPKIRTTSSLMTAVVVATRVMSVYHVFLRKRCSLS